MSHKVGAPTADFDGSDEAGVVYVVFGWQTGNDDIDSTSAWGASIDLEAVDGSNRFVVTGAIAGGHLG